MPKSKVMVALRDHSAELMGLAAQLTSALGGELIVLHVVQIPIATPIDAPDEVIDRAGREVLAWAAKTAKGKIQGSLKTRLLRARNVAEAIISEAREEGVDLLLLGHRRHPDFASIFSNSISNYVTRHAPCKVIVQVLPRSWKYQPGLYTLEQAGDLKDASRHDQPHAS